MNRTAIESALLHTALVVAAASALLVLAGCTTPDRIPVDRETVAAHELVDFMWCTPADGLLCVPLINQGGQFILLQPGDRIGDGARVWDERVEIVDALGRP